MLDVHSSLKQYHSSQDPLVQVADAVARESKVLCLDEFFVNDVADAAILNRLFARLWENGLVLVSTSNRAPDALYEGGLQRDLFLPFIEKLKVSSRCNALDRGVLFLAVFPAMFSDHHHPNPKPHPQPHRHPHLHTTRIPPLHHPTQTSPHPRKGSCKAQGHGRPNPTCLLSLMPCHVCLMHCSQMYTESFSVLRRCFQTLGRRILTCHLSRQCSSLNA